MQSDSFVQAFAFSGQQRVCVCVCHEFMARSKDNNNSSGTSTSNEFLWARTNPTLSYPLSAVWKINLTACTGSLSLSLPVELISCATLWANSLLTASLLLALSLSVSLPLSNCLQLAVAICENNFLPSFSIRVSKLSVNGCKYRSAFFNHYIEWVIPPSQAAIKSVVSN